MLNQDVRLGGIKHSSVKKDVHTPRGPHPDLFNRPHECESEKRMSPSSLSPSFGWGRIAGGPEGGGVYRVRDTLLLHYPEDLGTVFLSQGLFQKGIPTPTGKPAKGPRRVTNVFSISISL